MPRVARGAVVTSGKKKPKIIKVKASFQSFGEDSAWVLPFQVEVRDHYESDPIQLSVAGLIFANFFVSAIAAQMTPTEGSDAAAVFYVFEVLFAVLFGLELIWNMYGSWFRRFFVSGWNWFDFIIVIIAILSLTMSDLPGISVLRLFRAFRVFRLFKRIESLRCIIEGVVASIPGVANGFMVLLIIMGIWSIMGTEFFGKRDNCHQEFGNFLKSMFSMWQVMSGDSWASGIARKVIYDNNLPLASIYFVTYMMLASIIMLNVILAIFFDKYLQHTQEGGDNVIAIPNFDNAKHEQLLVLFTEVVSPSNLEALDEDEILDLTKIICTHSSSAFSILLSQSMTTKELSHIEENISPSQKSPRFVIGNNSTKTKTPVTKTTIPETTTTITTTTTTQQTTDKLNQKV